MISQKPETPPKKAAEPGDPGTETGKPPEVTPEELNKLVGALYKKLPVVARPMAEKVTGPHGLAAETLAKVFSADDATIKQTLEEGAMAIKEGSLTGLEATLATQATTLNALFHRLSQVAFQEPRSLESFSGFLKLALRAQSQSAHALETLGNLKQGPRVLITRQLNAAGQQFVNNGTVNSSQTTPVQKNCSVTADPPESTLLEPSTVSIHATLDTGSTKQTASTHPDMEAVDEIHRPRNGRRKTKE